MRTRCTSCGAVGGPQPQDAGKTQRMTWEVQPTVSLVRLGRLGAHAALGPLKVYARRPHRAARDQRAQRPNDRGTHAGERGHGRRPGRCGGESVGLLGAAGDARAGDGASAAVLCFCPYSPLSQVPTTTADDVFFCAVHELYSKKGSRPRAEAQLPGRRHPGLPSAPHAMTAHTAGGSLQVPPLACRRGQGAALQTHSDVCVSARRACPVRSVSESPPGCCAISYGWPVVQAEASTLLAKSKALLQGDQIAQIPTRSALAPRRVDKHQYASKSPRAAKSPRAWASPRGDAHGVRTGATHSKSVAAGAFLSARAGWLNPRACLRAWRRSATKLRVSRVCRA